MFAPSRVRLHRLSQLKLPLLPLSTTFNHFQLLQFALFFLQDSTTLYGVSPTSVAVTLSTLLSPPGFISIRLSRPPNLQLAYPVSPIGLHHSMMSSACAWSIPSQTGPSCHPKTSSPLKKGTNRIIPCDSPAQPAPIGGFQCHIRANRSPIRSVLRLTPKGMKVKPTQAWSFVKERKKK